MGNDKEGFYFKQFDSDTLKFGLILNEIPDKSKVVSIDGVEYFKVISCKMAGWENFNFYKIPDITASGKVVPEHIAGGYSIWHKTKKNHEIGKTNYETGKFGNIQKAKFINKDGKTIYGITEIKDGIFSEYCPVDFFIPETLPIRSNATFGNTTAGDDQVGVTGDGVFTSKFTLSEAGSVSKLTARVQAVGGTHHLKGMIYDDNGTSAYALTIQGVSNEQDITTTRGWFDLTFATPVSLAAGNWWLGIVFQTTNDKFDEDYTGSLIKDNLDSGGYASPGDFHFATNVAGEQVCIYATYTAGGGGETPKRRSQVIMFGKNKGKFNKGYYYG
jgi:hypothetical protein